MYITHAYTYAKHTHTHTHAHTPDCMIVLVSAIGGTVEQAQEEVAVGLGVLAGSTVMLLTIAWGGSLYAVTEHAHIHIHTHTHTHTYT